MDPNDPHTAGEIWSAALWQIWNALGRTKADTLVLRSHFEGLTSEARFGEGADAILAADATKFGSADIATLASIFRQRGIFDAFEWDSITSRASSITVNGTAQSRGFHSTNDTDWVKFTATAFGPSWKNAYVIRTFGLAVNVDTVTTLYAPDGVTVLASNDDCPGVGDRSSCLTWAASSTGTYYVQVTPYARNSNSTGRDKSYQIQVTTLALPKSVYLPIIMK